MQEQNAAIGVAIAGYYPDITLSGAFGYLGNPFMKQIAGANPVWSYGLSLAQPLFNGGLTDAQVEAARQTYEASVATYRQTVLTAFQQVEDQLVGDPRPHVKRSRCRPRRSRPPSRPCRSRSTNIAPARRTSRRS